MRYPKFLENGGTIGFTAPSFGCTTEPYKSCFEEALKRFGELGYKTEVTPDCYMSDGVGISTDSKECAKELPPEAWSRAHFPFVRSVDSVFTQYQKAVVPEQFAKVLYNGNRIEPEMIRSFEESMQQKPIRIYDEKDHFIGIYEFQQERGNFKPVKVFMEE